MSLLHLQMVTPHWPPGWLEDADWGQFDQSVTDVIYAFLI
jgi:hypothetical protein